MPSSEESSFNIHDSTSSSSSGDDEMIINAVQTYLTALQAAQRARASSSNTRPKKKKKAYMYRDRENANKRLIDDYFAENSRWGDSTFHRRFRMRRHLFLRIVHTLEAREDYFKQRNDAVGRQCISPLQKCTLALWQLANGESPDRYDEYLCVAESTGLECLKYFCKAVIEAFGDEYLRKPTAEDCRALLKMHEKKHGFPGMLGSIDCMHWTWKNCPTSWKDAYTRGDKGNPTIMLEAVASQNLWIWHAFFGVAASSNDVNVLNQSTVFNDVLNGKATHINFKANDNEYNMGYYLGDGAYPDWSTFVKTIVAPTNDKSARFKVMQEAARKDVERAFGVLQARWTIIKGPTQLLYRDHIHDIMYTCIILHNMIIEDEGVDATTWEDEGEASVSDPPNEVQRGVNVQFMDYLQRSASPHDKTQHHRLKHDLIEEIWSRFGPLP